MRKIKLRDLNFLHDLCSSRYQQPKLVEWYRGNKDCDVCVLTDLCLNMTYDLHDCRKIAWLLEPAAVSPQIYDFVIANHTRYDVVATHHKEFLPNIPNAVYVPFGGSWIKEQDWHDYPKTKLVSTITSNKKMTRCHVFRHKITQSFRSRMDVYGSGYNPIEYKLTALAEYKFSVTIENTFSRGYFSEKLIDCFATCTVPIYYGAPDVTEVFNRDGILIPKTLADLSSFLDPNFLNEFYERESTVRAIRENHETAKRFIVPDDNLYTIAILGENDGKEIGS